MILSITLIPILCHQVSAYEFLYSELEYLGGSCYPSDSCTPSREDDEDHLWGNYTCECGNHCVRYGTCCADSPHFGKVLHVEHRDEKCQALSTFPASVIIAARCSDRWRHGYYIRQKCEGNVLSMEDPVTMVPLTSLETLVTYKNYFCAVCNYDTRDIFMWNIAIELRTRESIPSLSNITQDYLLNNLFYNNERSTWGVMENNLFCAVRLRFRLPSSLQKFVKKCYPKMVTQCDSAYAYNYELQYKCLAYYSPISLQEIDQYLRRYRNIHCAICNNVTRSLTDSSICKMHTGRKQPKPSFSFALLLDINRNDGDIVGQKQMCKDIEKWDPFFKKCRSLVCGLPGHVIKDGKCVQS